MNLYQRYKGKGLETYMNMMRSPDVTFIRVWFWYSQFQNLVKPSVITVMATQSSKDILKDCIAATLKRKEYTVTSVRNSMIQEHGKILMDLFEDDNRCAEVEQFSIKLMCEIETIVLSAKKKEKILTAFHHFRVSQLPILWKDFCSENDIQESLDPLLYQSIFQDYFLNKIHTAKGNESSETKSYDSITVDEENVIRFIGGYIPHTILQNLKRRKSSEKKVTHIYRVLAEIGSRWPRGKLISIHC